MTTELVVSITDELVAELEALADLATDGPWQYVEHDDCEYIEGPCNEFICSSADHVHDSEFIAQANPQVIKALISERAELKRDAERYRWLRDGDSSKFLSWYACSFPHEQLGEAIDQAMQERQK